MAYKCQKLHIKYNQMFGTQIIPTYQKILMPLTSWLGYLLIIGIEPYHIKTLNEYETKCK